MSGEVKFFARYSYHCKGCIFAPSLPLQMPISLHTPKPLSTHYLCIFLLPRNHHLFSPPPQTIKTTSQKIRYPQYGGGILLLRTPAPEHNPFPISYPTPHPFSLKIPTSAHAYILIYFQPMFTTRFSSNITVFLYDIFPFSPVSSQPRASYFLCKSGIRFPICIHFPLPNHPQSPFFTFGQQALHTRLGSAGSLFEPREPPARLTSKYFVNCTLPVSA